MPIREPMPAPVERALKEEPLLSLKADVDEEGCLSERWLLYSTTEVVTATPDGTELRRLPIAAVTDARTAQAVGGGALIADTAEGAVVLVRYTAAYAGKFGLAARALKSLAKGEEVPRASAKDKPKLCSSCGRPLEEGTKVCPVCVDKGRVFNRLLSYARPYRPQLVGAAALMLLATVTELLPPYLTKLIVDHVVQPETAASALLWLVVSLGGARLAITFMQTLRGYLGVLVGARLMSDIRRDTYDALQELSLSYFDRRQTNQFIGRINQDTEAMRQFLGEGVIWVAGQFLMLACVATMMINLNWKLGLLALLPVPLVLLASSLIWPYIRNRWYRQWRSINQLNMIVGDALQGIRVVKAFGQEPQEKQRYAEANREVLDQGIKTDSLWQAVFPTFGFVIGSGALLVWFFGGHMVLGQELSLGTLIAFISYLQMMLGPLQFFSQALNWTSRAMAAADRVFEIIDAPRDVADAPDAAALDGVEGSVVLENVTFGYEHHHPVLKELSLTVEPGEMIGLVGHSGAGKSTLINLICRFYDPDQGRITLDGTDLRQVRQEDLRRRIGVVLQETFLFDGTVAENIAYAKPGATPEEILWAARVANAHDFITRMSDGYDTRSASAGTGSPAARNSGWPSPGRSCTIPGF